MKNVKIGDVLVCVDDSPCSNCNSDVNLQKNGIYVVARVMEYKEDDSCISVGSNTGCHNKQCSSARYWGLGMLGSRRFKKL